MSLNKDLAAKLKAAQSLPTPPTLATEIIDLSNDPDVSLAEVGKVIGKDPALTSKILRIANSAVYAGRREATNLRQALITLGLNPTLTLALSFSLSSGLKTHKSAGLNFDLYWQRSVVASCACRALAAEVQADGVEEIFLAGLLQDIGMLALDKVASEVYADVAEFEHDHAAVCARERELLGTDHAEVGAWMLRDWKIPDELARVVELSHEPGATEAHQPEGRAARIVALSSDFAYLWLNGDIETDLPGLARKTQELLGLDENEIAETFELLVDRIKEAEDLFDLSVNSALPAELLLEQAREALLLRNIMAVQEVNTLKADFSDLSRRTEALEQESRRDNLTKLFNRAHFDETLEQEFRAARENAWPLSLAFVDLDHFKRVNDTYGHQAGDEVLRVAARTLQDCVRDTDTLARYGGEEFVVVLPGCKSADLETVCQRMLEAIRETKFDLGSQGKLSVTTSIGAATYSLGANFETPEALLKAADEAVYAAKTGGRDRAVYDRDNAAPVLAQVVNG